MNINKTQLYDNFGNKKSKSLSNLKITSCNVLSSKEDIISNSGFYSLLIIFFIFIIIFIIFCIKGYRLLENKMDEVIYKKFEKDKKGKNAKRKTAIKTQGHNPLKKNNNLKPKIYNKKNLV